MGKRAAGFLIFRRLNSQIEYLLLQTSYGQHHWSPPKGHVDPGEDDFTTALRETREEAGYTENDLLINKDIQKILSYQVNNKPKIVVYWLAELKDPQNQPTLSDEHIAFKWLNKSETIKLAGYKDFADMIEYFHLIKCQTQNFIYSNNTTAGTSFKEVLYRLFDKMNRFFKINLRFHSSSVKYNNFIESLTASTSGIDLSDLNETIKETPELINFKDPKLWQKTHDFLKAEGFSTNRFLSMVSKYPNVMYKSNDTLQRSMVSWRACQFGEKNVIELLENYPQLLEITDESELTFKTLEFKNYVGNRKNVWRLYMNSPNIIYDKLKISEAKFNYLQNVMKVEASEIVKSAVFSLNLDVIRCRHKFLERLGSYKIRSEKENAAESSRNPNLSQIMDTSEKRFAVKVAFVTLEEFQAFQDLYNKELNTYSSMEDDHDLEKYDEIDDNDNVAEVDVPARLPRKIYSKGKR